MKKKYILGFMALLVGSSLMLTSCEKNLEVEPNPTFGLDPEDAIKSPEDMQQLLLSCYDACANMMNGQLQLMNDLMGDDVTKPTNNDGGLTGIYNRQSNQFNGYLGGAYSQPYFTIYRCNIMDLYYDQISLSEAEENRLKGEAAFLRALCHFEAVKLWAQPAGYSTDNSHLGIVERTRARNEVVLRSSVSSNYNLIINDLAKAIDYLPVSNSVYANKNAAKALLAKVYFTMGRYNDALTLLNEVIGAGYTLSDSLNRFKRAETAQEIIFGFVSAGTVYDVNSRSSTFKDAYRNDLLSGSTLPILGMSDELYTLMMADTNDQRGKKFVRTVTTGTGGTFAMTTKYNMNDFATPYLTLTDMLLMRAEIHAMNGDAASALADVLPIVKRAYKPSAAKEVALTGMSAIALLDEIRLQRRLEMHMEGDRLTQLKRIGVLKGKGNLKVRGANWDCDGMVLQFPSSAGTVRGFVFNPSGGCN